MMLGRSELALGGSSAGAENPKLEIRNVKQGKRRDLSGRNIPQDYGNEEGGEGITRF